jgi:ribosome-associated protein
VTPRRGRDPGAPVPTTPVDDVLVDRRLRIPRSEISFQFARSGGAGGQNVNKVSSKAVLRWRVMESPSLPDAVRSRFAARFRRRITHDGELVLTSQRYRDQHRNVEDCLEKLRGMLAAVADEPVARRPTAPGPGARERRLEGKRLLAQKKRRRRAVDERAW